MKKNTLEFIYARLNSPRYDIGENHLGQIIIKDHVQYSLVWRTLKNVLEEFSDEINIVETDLPQINRFLREKFIDRKQVSFDDSVSIAINKDILLNFPSQTITNATNGVAYHYPRNRVHAKSDTASYELLFNDFKFDERLYEYKKPEIFLKLQQSVFGNDENIQLFDKYFTFMLTGKARYGKILYTYGDSGTGKSTFIKILSSIFNGLVDTTIGSLFSNDPWESKETVLNISAPIGILDDENISSAFEQKDILKQLLSTGGKKIAVRPQGSRIQKSTVYLNGLLMFSNDILNILPNENIDTETDGIFNRIVFINTKENRQYKKGTISEDEINKTINNCYSILQDIVLYYYNLAKTFNTNKQDTYVFDKSNIHYLSKDCYNILGIIKEYSQPCHVDALIKYHKQTKVINENNDTITTHLYAVGENRFEKQLKYISSPRNKHLLKSYLSLIGAMHEVYIPKVSDKILSLDDISTPTSTAPQTILYFLNADPTSHFKYEDTSTTELIQQIQSNSYEDFIKVCEEKELEKYTSAYLYKKITDDPRWYTPGGRHTYILSVGNQIGYMIAENKLDKSNKSRLLSKLYENIETSNISRADKKDFIKTLNDGIRHTRNMTNQVDEIIINEPIEINKINEEDDMKTTTEINDIFSFEDNFINKVSIFDNMTDTISQLHYELENIPTKQYTDKRNEKCILLNGYIEQGKKREDSNMISNGLVSFEYDTKETTTDEDKEKLLNYIKNTFARRLKLWGVSHGGNGMFFAIHTKYKIETKDDYKAAFLYETKDLIKQINSFEFDNAMSNFSRIRYAPKNINIIR